MAETKITGIQDNIQQAKKVVQDGVQAVQQLSNVVQGGISKIGGNVTIGNTNIHKNSKPADKNEIFFQEVEVNELLNDDYYFPKFSKNIHRRWINQRIIFIGGNYNFNNGSFIKHLSAQIATKKDSYEIKEGFEISNINSLVKAIEKAKNATVFVFNQIEPSNIAYQVLKLKRLLENKNHYLIIGTDKPLQSWHFPENFDHTFWFDVPETDIYDILVLHEKLETELSNKNIELEISSMPIAKEFSTIEQIELFTELLSREKKKNSSTIVKLIEQIVKNNLTISQWFYSLNPRNKLIAIGLTLLDGLFEEQFFASMQKMIDEGEYFKSIGALDYFDLSLLMNYFKIENNKIVGILDNQKRELLTVAWKSHRRHIIATLPILVQMVEDSVYQQSSNWELYETKYKRQILRNKISEILSEIGLISEKIIEPSLLRLAAQRHIGIHTVVAKAIARWIVAGQENKVFELLERWQASNQVATMVKKYISNKEDNPETYVEATVVLTLGYAAQYYNVGQLNNKIISLLKDALHTSSSLVEMKLQETIERVTSYHPKQMENVLFKKFLKRPNFIPYAAFGLATAYNRGYSTEVKDILNKWDKSLDEEPKKRTSSTRNKLYFEDKILCTISLIYKYLDYNINYNNEKPMLDAASPFISIQEAYQKLDAIRTKYHQADVRGVTLDSQLYLIELNIKLRGQENLNYLTNVSFAERRNMVNLYIERYFEERKPLKGGKFTAIINETKIFIWENAEERPKTEIEGILDIFIKNGTPIFQQIGSLVYLDIFKIWDEEVKLIKAAKELENQKTAIIPTYLVKSDYRYTGEMTAREKTNSFIKKTQKFLSERQTQLLKGIAPLLIQVEDLDLKHGDKLVEKFKDEYEERTINKVQKLYREFRSPYNIRTIIIISIVVILIIIALSS